MTGTHLFAYGTLMSEVVLRKVTGETFPQTPGTLSGFSRYAIRGEVYPGLIEEEPGRVEGVVYFGLSTAAWNLLDRFEGYMYKKINVLIRCNHEQVSAETYLLKLEYRSVLEKRSWNFDAFLREGIHRFVF
jgi:gamma-glutamylcyclotransferase (GGCT)/AIG2-like uncharacterized protein YtfP